MTEIMTLSDFKKAIEEWGKGWGIKTEVIVGGVCTSVFAKRNEEMGKACVARILNNDAYVMEIDTNALGLRHTMRRPLFEIVTKFANTWPADRKDKEKKFRITFDFDFDADADWSAEDVEILVKESLSTVYPFRKFMQYLKVEEEDA